MISTHILDTSNGTPAQNVEVVLDKRDGDSWTKLATEKTNADGRISFNCPRVAGDYRLSFEIEEYFKLKNLESFFLATPVVFKIVDINRKYHVPLLLNPYGYTTYRGS